MHSSLSAPSTLDARWSYFFVGGHYSGEDAAREMSGQMYVQVIEPAPVTQRYPIVMMHGMAQTGNTFLATPDGRPGWVQDFASRGYRVYVVDQVGRGRSGTSSKRYGPYATPSMAFIQLVIGQKASGLWPQVTFHTQWPGDPVPGDPVFDQFVAQQVEYIASGVKTEEMNLPANLALLEHIGPAIVLTHSQSGAFNWPVADARPNLIKALVAVEPSGPPVHDIENTGAPDWFKDAERTKISGLADVPLAYDPPLPAGAQLEFVHQDKADAPDLVRCWLQKEPPRRLPSMAHIPVVIVSAEASYHAAYDHCTAAYLRQAGVPNAHIRLAEMGVHGNGHMMMLEKNSDAITGVIAQWLEQQRLREDQPKAAR